MNRKSRVLIIDPSEATREVLQTVLEQQGIQTLVVQHPSQAEAWIQRFRPDVIVRDMDWEPVNQKRDLSADSVAGETPVVMLGSVHPARHQSLRGEFVVKPYHYGSLIRKIEEMLKGSPQPHRVKAATGQIAFA